MASRIARRLSFFNPVTRIWTPVLSKTIQSHGPQKPLKTKPITSAFDIISWNIDFASPLPNRRFNDLIDHVFESGAPDILFLQGSGPTNRKIREAFYTTDAEDDLVFGEDKPFATMTLLSNKRFAYNLDSLAKETAEESEGGEKFILGPVFREELPNTFIRLINVHLDSRDRFFYRSQQLRKLASPLREPGCSGGLIAGDFNSVSDEEHKLIEESGLEDAWLMLYGSTDPDAPTWSVGRRREAEFEPKRLDKIARGDGDSAPWLHRGAKAGWHVWANRMERP